MALDTTLLREIHCLNYFVHDNAREYFHTRPVARSTHELALPGKVKHSFEIEHGLKDLLFIGAITNSSVLMTGGTDTGKTTVAKLMMNGLLGKEETGWHRIDVDTDFGKDALADTNFAIVTEGKKLSEGLYTAQGFLGLPGIIWDEINRTHAGLANKLMHVFDRDISLPSGQRVRLGVLIPGTEETFQFQIAAINEGRGYGGTFDIDKALRRRTIIEIPMDIFPLTPYDNLCIQKYGRKHIELRNTGSHLDALLQIYQAMESSIQLHPIAEMFVAYLEAFDYCKNSLTGEKGGIASRSDNVHHVCTQPASVGGAPVAGGEIGCEFLRTFDNNLCPYVRALTAGVSKNLRSVARGFAVLRATKFAEMLAGFAAGEHQKPLSYTVSSPEKFTDSLQKYTGTRHAGKELARAAVEQYHAALDVEKGDIEAALGFVGYSKVGISGAFTEKYFQGNKFEAIRNFSAQADKKFREGLAEDALQNIGRVLQGQGTPEELGRIKSYCGGQNPWLWRVISPYLAKKDGEEEHRQRALQLYGG